MTDFKPLVGISRARRQATITVQGLRQGEAKLWMRYVSGISIYNVVVGEMIVDDALGVTVSPVASTLASAK